MLSKKIIFWLSKLYKALAGIFIDLEKEGIHNFKAFSPKKIKNKTSKNANGANKNKSN